MNLRPLERSRKRLAPGDIFVMLPPDGLYLFGRVVSTTVGMMGIKCILSYVYKARAAVKDQIPKLSPVDLLIAPQITNKTPWLDGYFETVGHRELLPDERLPRHCFRAGSGYVDEHGVRIPERIPPVGFWGLGNFRTVDFEVSAALGIPPNAD